VGNYGFIDYVLLTHADKDHVSGLIELLEHYKVGALWMHRPWLYASEIIGRFHGNFTLTGLEKDIRSRNSLLVDLEEVAIRKGVAIHEAFQGNTVGQFTILAPTKARYLDLLSESERMPTVYETAAGGLTKALDAIVGTVRDWINESWTGETLSENPGATSPINETSVVQLASLDGKQIVLTGDVGPAGLREAAAYAQQRWAIGPAFFQVPHHGSRRNITPTALNEWLGAPAASSYEPARTLAFCSAAADDPDHPRKKVMNAFIRRRCMVNVTRGNTVSYAQGVARPGWGPAPVEEFSSVVED